MNSTKQSPSSSWALWRPYVMDIVAPLLGYLIVQAFGAGAMWALTIAGIVAATSTAINTIRRKGLDALGILILLEIVASIVVVLFFHDPRLLMIRPSIYTAVAAVFLMNSAFIGQPLSFAGSRAMAAKGGPARIFAFELAWDQSYEFRRTHKWVTFGFGVALALDSVLRIVIVYRFSVDRSAWLSNIPHMTAMILIIAVSALAGRRFNKIVDGYMPNPQSQMSQKPYA